MSRMAWFAGAAVVGLGGAFAAGPSWLDTAKDAVSSAVRTIALVILVVGAVAVAIGVVAVAAVIALRRKRRAAAVVPVARWRCVMLEHTPAGTFELGCAEVEYAALYAWQVQDRAVRQWAAAFGRPVDDFECRAERVTDPRRR